MSRQPYSLNNYVGGAVPATLNADINNSTTTVVVNDTDSSWGTLGISGGFFLSLNYGTATEEKIWVPSGDYNWSSPPVTLTNVQRNADGTSPQNLNAGSPVVPILTAKDLEEANALVAQILGSGNLSTTSGMAIVSTGTGITYGQVASSGSGGTPSSLSGPGLTDSPGLLTQSGGFTVIDKSNTGINFTTSGNILISGASINFYPPIPVIPISGTGVPSFSGPGTTTSPGGITQSGGLTISDFNGDGVNITTSGATTITSASGFSIVDESENSGNNISSANSEFNIQSNGYLNLTTYAGFTITQESSGAENIVIEGNGSNPLQVTSLQGNLELSAANATVSVLGSEVDIIASGINILSSGIITISGHELVFYPPVVSLLSGTGVSSLSGSGILHSPGTLTQSGGFNVWDPNGDGVSVISTGPVSISGFGINLGIIGGGYSNIVLQNNSVVSGAIDLYNRTPNGFINVANYGIGNINIIQSGTGNINVTSRDQINLLASGTITISGESISFYPSLPSGYASLTGSGLTNTPGLLTQSGGLTISDLTGEGVNFFLAGGINIQDNSSTGINLVEASGVITAINNGNGGIQFYDNGNGGTYFQDNGTGGIAFLSTAGITLQENTLGINIISSGTVAISGSGFHVYNSGKPTISGALSAVTDTNAKAVMTSIIAVLSGYGLAINGTT